MRSYAPLVLLVAAATAAPSPQEHNGKSKHGAGTCDPIVTNSTMQLEAEVSSLLADSKATGSFVDSLTALLSNSSNSTAPAAPETGSAGPYGGSGSSTDASSLDDSSSSDTSSPDDSASSGDSSSGDSTSADASSPDDSTSSDDLSAPVGSDSSSTGGSGQAVPAAASGRLDAIKKAAEKLRGSHGASGGVLGEASGDASRDASGSASGGASGVASGVASGGAGGRPSLLSAKDLKDGASTVAHGTDTVAAGAKAAGAIEHDVSAASDRSVGVGMGRLGALRRPGHPEIGGLRRHHGPGPLGGMRKRQTANSLEDVVGMDLNKLSEEELKELDGENVAARDVTHPTNGDPITARDAALTAVLEERAFDRAKLNNGNNDLVWQISEPYSRVGRREAEPQTTAGIEKREAEPQTAAGIEKREAEPTNGAFIAARDDAAPPPGGPIAVQDPEPSPGGPVVKKREADALPQTAVLTGFIGKREADSPEPTNGPGHSITAREAAPAPQDTANLGWWFPGNDKREAAPNDPVAPIGGALTGDVPEPTWKDPEPTSKDPPHPVTKREAAPEEAHDSIPLRAREGEPSGFYTSTLLRARDDAYLDPATPPTYGGPTPR